ncbi:MAG: hypothetical protein IPL80_19945 [Sterolibacteriaceae bacterium]|nr:hypothetical protein [Sterolibacteriaceae bacterium]
MILADALSLDPAASVVTATVVKVRTDSVDVDFGNGQVAERVPVVAWSQPSSGVLVQVVRRAPGSWLCLGPVVSGFSTTVTHAWGAAVPWNVLPGVPAVANPFVVSVSWTASWRDADGWSGGYMPTTDTVAQGASGTSLGYYRGLYGYGDGAFAPLLGRRCTTLSIRLHRLGVGGTSAATQQVLGPHVHATQPSGEPLFPWGAANVAALAWNAVSPVALPTEWGDLLINGQAAGIGHLLLASGYGNQSYAAGKAADALTGQLSIGWA